MAKKKASIATEEEIVQMSLMRKLANIQRSVEVLRKNGSGYNYDYVTDDEVQAYISAGMEDFHVFLYYEIVPGTKTFTPYTYTKTKKVKNGDAITETVNEIIVSGELNCIWVNLDNEADTLTVPWTFIGQNSDASQALGSGLTYAIRYFKLKFFNVATPKDDPDNWRSKKMEVSAAEERAVVGVMIDEINTLVSDYLGSFKEPEMQKKHRTELTALIKKYVKDGNGKPTGDYRHVKTVDDAAKLMEAIKEFIGGKE